MGGLIAVSKLDALAHGFGAGVVSVTGTLINGAMVDLQAPQGAVFQVLTVDIAVA